MGLVKYLSATNLGTKVPGSASTEKIAFSKPSRSYSF